MFFTLYRINKYQQVLFSIVSYYLLDNKAIFDTTKIPIR